jgi:hypothetical protein
VRSGRLDPGGGAAAPAGRAARLPSELDLSILCSPDEGVVGERLVRSQFEMGRFEWEGGVEFHLAHGDWIRLLRRVGLEIENLVELQAPPDAETHPYYDFVSAEWARRWPAEEIWVARKR